MIKKNPTSLYVSQSYIFLLDKGVAILMLNENTYSYCKPNHPGIFNPKFNNCTIRIFNFYIITATSDWLVQSVDQSGATI